MGLQGRIPPRHRQDRARPSRRSLCVCACVCLGGLGLGVAGGGLKKSGPELGAGGEGTRILQVDSEKRAAKIQLYLAAYYPPPRELGLLGKASSGESLSETTPSLVVLLESTLVFLTL
jgi:hypothetical protein